MGVFQIEDEGLSGAEGGAHRLRDRLDLLVANRDPLFADGLTLSSRRGRELERYATVGFCMSHLPRFWTAENRGKADMVEGPSRSPLSRLPRFASKPGLIDAFRGRAR
ncbi:MULTISPECIES: hypothetical protein [unclassified Microbacterium]|uniref:hypothetical protein n=1 Tax=Microbacterium TaxID=33882 RepID=UPI003B9E5A66